MTDAPMKLSASQVSLILQRAAAIDARGVVTSVLGGMLVRFGPREEGLEEDL